MQSFRENDVCADKKAPFRIKVKNNKTFIIYVSMKYTLFSDMKAHIQHKRKTFIIIMFCIYSSVNGGNNKAIE